MIGTEGYQRQMPCAFDRVRERALVLGADTGLAPRLDLPPVGHIAAESLYVFVVDVLDVVDAEPAYLPAAVVPGSAATGSATRAAPAATRAAPAATRAGSAPPGPEPRRSGASRSRP